MHGGGCLYRYAPDGRLDRIVTLPVQNPTMMAFCGPDLCDLYVTSATHGKPSKPHEGGIFRMHVGRSRSPHLRPLKLVFLEEVAISEPCYFITR